MLYRAMIADGDHPLVVSTARGLGVRPEIDIPVDEYGQVEPGEGMSVAHTAFEFLPEHRRPPSAGGTGKDPLWKISSDDLPAALSYRPDDDVPGHGFIEPSWAMTIEEYELALAETREI